MKIVKLLLYPFAILYNLATQVRNYLYDIGQKPSIQFETAVIAVGNLNVGGSGKTPMVEYIIHLLKDQFVIATLSRGYKRDTKGYHPAQESDTSRSLGDEPMQFMRKFGSEVQVVVGEDRVQAIPRILKDFPTTDVILLDDALQHRSVKPQLTILVTDCAKPFYRDFLLPLGRLREARIGARRVDIVVVTKCAPSLTKEAQMEMTKSIQRYAGDKPVFFSTIQYGLPASFGANDSVAPSIVLVTGIARTDPLTQHCLSNFTILRHFKFPDHHRYSTTDLQEIEQFCLQQSSPYSIITTEKDMVKLIEPEFKLYLQRLPWFYMPIRQVFLEDGLKFDGLILGVLPSSSKRK
jgi:tetraacyldisaccharide 4'-kinase